MDTRDGKAATAFINEAEFPPYFGEWIKCRRQELDLTQAELAQRSCCTVFTIRKVETGERRPSRQLAELFAKALEIPSENQDTFIKVARGELSLEKLVSLVRAPSRDFQPIPTSNEIPGNIPRSLTPFIGREPELDALGILLRDPECRLLSLVGPGGIGKTRLAVEVAARHKNLFPDGVWFVSLAPLRSSAFLVPTIADALNFRFQDPTDPQEQLLRFLKDKRALIVLDNAEHLLDGIGLFTEILKRDSQVKILVTTRERVNLLCEWVFEIQGLPVPPSDEVEHFEEFSSVGLFLQSALRTQAGFKLRDEERSWVVQICQSLEGLPLGIELSAAWSGLLSVEEIAKEIKRNLDFLEVSLRDIPERHRSLRAMLDHSWNLLSPKEKEVLSRLSVFRGSFSREAAQAIGGASLNVLSSLKDKSLLRRTEQDRYDLHELIRQYATLKLAEDAHEDERVKDLHALYYAQRLEEWEKALKSSLQMETLERIALEIDNLRQAWQRIIRACDFDDRTSAPVSLSLFRGAVFSLSLFFEMRCRYWEAVTLFGQAVDAFQSAKESAAEIQRSQEIDVFLGFVMAYLGYHQYLMQYTQARETVEEALRLLENDPSKIGQAHAQIILAWIYQANGEYQKEVTLFQKSLEFFKQEGDEWWCTLSTSWLAASYLVQGYISESVALFEESLARTEPGDLRLGVQLRTHLGYARFFLGDYPEAERLLRESLDLSLQLGNRRQMAYNYRLLGQVAMALGQNEQALKYFQECIAVFEGYGESPDLALCLIYLGKGLLVRMEIDAAREKFLQVIKIGQSLHVFYLVFWAFVNLARGLMVDGQPEKALEMVLSLEQYSVEAKVVRDDRDHLLAELQAKLSAQQVEGVMQRVKGASIDSLLEQT